MIFIKFLHGVVQVLTTINFCHPQKLPTPVPCQVTTSGLCLQVYLFWMFHINGIIQHDIFWVWLSLNMFLRFL